MPTSLTTLTYLRLNNRRKVIDLCIRWPLKRVALTSRSYGVAFKFLLLYLNPRNLHTNQVDWLSFWCKKAKTDEVIVFGRSYWCHHNVNLQL